MKFNAYNYVYYMDNDPCLPSHGTNIIPTDVYIQTVGSGVTIATNTTVVSVLLIHSLYIPRLVQIINLVLATIIYIYIYIPPTLYKLICNSVYFSVQKLPQFVHREDKNVSHVVPASHNGIRAGLQLS